MPDAFTDSIVVLGTLSDVYHLWADFTNFPVFMRDVKSVAQTGERTSHWVMQGPLGATVEWEAETTRLEEDRRIAWSSKDNSPVKTSGQVIFEELGPNETQITITLHYAAPAGKAGEALAQLFADPQGRVHGALKHFKDHVESTATRLREGTPLASLTE